MKKYSVMAVISFILSVIGLVILTMIYFGKLHSTPLLWTAMACVIVAAILSIYRWIKTKEKKRKK